MSARIAVDSSAIVAILNGEAEATHFAAAIVSAHSIIGWPTILEVRLWLARRPPEVAVWFDAFLTETSVEKIAFSGEHESLASAACARFGKGLHSAKLNFGDCMSYAIAMREGVPLLFKGGDFGKTDVTVHPASVAV